MQTPHDILVIANQEGVSYLERHEGCNSAVETTTVRWENINDVCAKKRKSNNEVVTSLFFSASGESLYRVTSEMAGWTEFVAYLSRHLPDHMIVRRPDWVRCLEVMEPGSLPMLVALKEHSKLQLYADEPGIWWIGPESTGG